MQRAIRLVLCGFMTLSVMGCQGGATEDENVIAPDGKEDNFFSNVAQEYLASATVSIALDAADAQKPEADRLAKAREIMEGKTKQLTWFLHVYLIDKSSHGEDNPAVHYGGLRAMVLDGSYQTDSLKADPQDPAKFSFAWSIQVGGTKELMSKVRAANNLGPDENTFGLRMAQLANWQVINFSSGGYKPGTWSPESCGCTLETVQVKLEPIPPSNDSYLDYGKMLADGVMDISVHFGWDYYARYDLVHSRSFYDWLLGLGFKSPAESYEKYTRLSGPLTKKVTVNGREIELQVTVFRPDPCESFDEAGSGGSWEQARAKDEKNQERACPDYNWGDPNANANPTTSSGAGNLMSDLKASLKSRDAILFSGHSGYTYGYALASWYRTSAGDLDPPEIKTLDLPRDRSQLFVLSGCETYHAAQAFRDNPSKKGLVNADVITTTSFSNAGDVSDTKDIVRALLGIADENSTSSSASYSASSYGKILSSLNPSQDYGWGNFTMYGVHGLDDNPLGNPLGDATKSCTTCEKDADCSASGNVCVRLNNSEKVCAVECLHDKGCGVDQVCRQFGSATTGYLRGKACVPRTLSCGVTPPPPPPTPKQFTGTGDLKRNEQKSFTVQVGPTAKSIKVVMTGTGDADLYTKFGSAPTTSKYTCRPYKNGSGETCTHTKATAANLEIMVRGYANASHFDLKVTWE